LLAARLINDWPITGWRSAMSDKILPAPGRNP
jgi:hypothetical protein